MQDVLKAAMSLHQAGNLAQAGELYQTILVSEPENAEAMHLLGVLHHQQGAHTRAVELMGRAVALRPNAAAFHANLAEAYRALGQYDRAAGSCRAALGLKPDYPEATANLGLVLQAMGRRAEAADQFREAIKLRPGFAAAHSNLGNVLRESGRKDEALGHFRRAIELDPRDPLSRTNLGQMLLELDRAEEALPHCQEAVRLLPHAAALHHNLGNALRELERYDEARAAYLQALRLDPRLAKAHAQLGLLLKREGRLDEAAVCLKRAIELDPADADLAEFLGDLCVARQDFGEAINYYTRAIAISPVEKASAHVSLGWALQEEGRLGEAHAHYREAQRIQPGSAAVFIHLGKYHEECGELAQAEADYRRALELQGGNPLPLALLGSLLRSGLPAEDLAALERHATDYSGSLEVRTRLAFALGHVLDARGDYARAAACIRQANALTLESRRGQNSFTPADHERFVDNVLKRFDQSFLARTYQMGSESRRPVFIFGLPRSGTSLIEQVLASHSSVHGAGELRLGRQSYEAIPQVMGRNDHPMECIADLGAHSIRRLAELHLERLRVLAPAGAGRVIDKMPDNYMYVGLLATLFPRAVFIHCRRDLRDVALSCWMTDFRSMTWPFQTTDIAQRFKQYRRLMDHWRAALPVPIHDVDYESTVNDLESVARRLVALCGLEWEPSCLEFHRNNRPVRTASLVQVRRPVYTSSVGRWKNYESELAELFAAVSPPD
jgi:tetratricopeptide (TPR) repeat protein